MLAPSPVVQALQSVKALLADADHWTKGDDARDDSGRRVSPGDIRARSFCLQGAVLKVTWADADRDRRLAAFTALQHVARKRGFMSFPSYNDHPVIAHQAVLGLIDEAIAYAASGEMSPSVYDEPATYMATVPINQIIWFSGSPTNIWFSEANSAVVTEAA